MRRLPSMGPCLGGFRWSYAASSEEAAQLDEERPRQARDLVRREPSMLARAGEDDGHEGEVGRAARGDVAVVDLAARVQRGVPEEAVHLHRRLAELHRRAGV